MSKKLGLVLSTLFILILGIYLAYDATFFNKSMAEFLMDYLGNYQTYFFIFTLLLPPFILVNHINYLNPEYMIRIGTDLLIFILRKVFISSIQLTVIIYTSFIIGGLIMGLPGSWTIKLFPQLFSYITACFLLFQAVYLLVGKSMTGIVVVIAGNLLFLAAIHGLGFILIVDDTLFYRVFYMGSAIYIGLVLTISLVIVSLTSKSKECYS